MLAWILSVVVALLLAAAPVTAEEQRRVALVIGNDTYKSLAPLDNPTHDAGRLAALLDASGFDVVRCDGERLGCFNLSRDGLEDALHALRRKAKGAELALVFYAGHGMEGSGGNVLAPIDMEVSDCTERALRRAVSLNEVFGAVAEARRKIVILDACRNNPFAQCPPARGSRPASFGDFAVSEVESFLLVSSTKPGQVASDGYPGAHSPYVRALLHWLQQAPQVQFHQLLSHVAKDVIEDTARANDTQVPEMVLRGGGAEGCLKGADCAGDLQAAALRQEVEALKERHKDDQRVAETVRGYLAEAEKGHPLSEEEMRQVVASLKQVGDLFVEVEKGQGRPFSRQEKTQELARLMEAGRALLALKDTRSERALELLKAGDETEAKRLFAEAAAARQEAARVAEHRAAEENREAAKALRHLAAIAKPKSVAEAADRYREATRLDPADAQTWIDYGRTALAAGRMEDAKGAFEQADTKARAGGNVPVRVRAALGLGDIEPAGTPSEERHYGEALALAKQLAKTDPDGVASQRVLSVAHGRIGDVLRRKNELSAALESYKTSLAIAKRLANAQPDDSELQQNVCWAYQDVGTVLASQGKHVDALASYQSALDIAERHSKSNPDNGEWLAVRRNLHGSISDVQQTLGDPDGALSSAQTALDIAEHLDKVDPSNTGWRLLLAIAHSRIGSLLRQRGDRTGALTRYSAATAISERLAALDSRNVLFQQGLAARHIGMGSVLEEEGRLADALASYQAAYAVYKGLSASTSASAEWHENIATSQSSIASILEAQGNLAGALESYRAAVENYSKADTGKSLPRLLLSDTHAKIARVLKGQGDLTGALASYRAMQTLIEQQRQADPGNADWQQRSVIGHAFTAALLRDQGDLVGALAGFRAALAGVGKINRADTDWQGIIGEMHTNIGGLLRQLGDLDGALASYRAALAIDERFAKAEPGNSKRQAQHGFSHANIGAVLREQGDLAGALASYRAALAICEALARAEPTINPWQLQLGVAHGNVAAVLEIQNDLGGALVGYRAALDINVRLARADPANADWQSNLFYWHGKVGGVLLRQRNPGDALSSHRAALAIAEGFVKANPANLAWQWSLASATHNVASVLYAKGDRAEALARWRTALAIAEGRAAAVEREETKAGGKAGKMTAETLGSLAYYAIYARDFRKALAAAEAAHALAPDIIWPQINRATALMLLGRPREARPLFLAHKDKSTLGDTWPTVVASAFRGLRAAGLTNPTMRQVEAALGVAPKAARPSAGERRANK
jgi:tetratricopeptide (TPR) repeat protein